MMRSPLRSVSIFSMGALWLLMGCNLGYDTDSVQLHEDVTSDQGVDPQHEVEDQPTDDPRVDLVVDQVVEVDTSQDPVVDIPLEVETDADVIEECAYTDLGMALGRSVSTGNTGIAGNDQTGSCGGELGADLVFLWRAPQSSSYHFDTTGTRFPAILYIRDLTCDGEELACHVAPATSPYHMGIDLSLEMGQAIFIFLDTASELTGNYALNILDRTVAETNCDNELDEDIDGSPDCLDPGCQAEEDACSPGQLPAGSPCAAHNQCVATGNDPICFRQALNVVWTDGYCSEFCSSDDPCEGDSYCFEPENLSWGICLATCDNSVEPTGCREGYSCIDTAQGTDVCLPIS